MSSINYHKLELKIAMSADDDRKIVPKILDNEKFILDIGCGIGQTLLALEKENNRVLVGSDIDKDAIEFGKKHYGGRIDFVHADAANLPFKDNEFDFIYSRVSFPYMNIPVVINEIKRVLKKDGRVWLTLHSKERTIDGILNQIKLSNFISAIKMLYVLLNGYLFKYFGILVPYKNNKYESWQSEKRMKKILKNSGFNVTIDKSDRFFIINASLSL